MPNKQTRRKVDLGCWSTYVHWNFWSIEEQVQSAKRVKTTKKSKIKRKMAKKTENLDCDITDAESVQVGSEINKVKKIVNSWIKEKEWTPH